MTLDDFKHVHFAIIIFGFETDACMNYGIFEKDGHITANKPYYALINQVLDSWYLGGGSVLVTFDDDSDSITSLQIPIDLFNGKDISIYLNRTSHELLAYKSYIADKVTERLENGDYPDNIDMLNNCLPCCDSRKDYFEIIKQVCFDEGLCNQYNDRIDITFNSYTKNFDVLIQYRHNSSYSFSVDVDKNIYKRKIETIQGEIEELKKKIKDKESEINKLGGTSS